MSKVIKKAYAEEMKQGYNLRTAMPSKNGSSKIHPFPAF